MSSNAQPIIGHKILRLLQTPAQSMGVVLEEFGEAFSITLVAELDDGRMIQINECDWEEYLENRRELIPAQLVQSEYTLKNIEGQKIQSLIDDEERGFYIVLENKMCLSCQSAPGGNMPLLCTLEEFEADV